MSDKIIYHVSLPPAEVLSRIAGSTDKSVFDARHPFKAKIKNNRFQIGINTVRMFGEEVIHPFVYGAVSLDGEIEEAGDGSKIRVKAGYRLDFIIKIASLLFFVFFSFFRGLYEVFALGQKGGYLLILASFILFVVNYAMVRFHRRDKERLRSFFDDLFRDSLIRVEKEKD